MDQESQVTPQQTVPQPLQPEALPPQKHTVRNILLIVLGVVVVAGAVLGIKQLVSNAAPHRKVAQTSSGTPTQSFTSSGAVATPTDNKGAWVKLGQDWRVPLTQGSQVNYAVASDGTRAFVSISSFSSAKSELRAYEGVTGKLDWDVTFSSDMAPYGKPVADGGVVVQSTNKGELIAYDAATGKELWRKTAGPFFDRVESYGVFLDGVFYYTQNSTSGGKDIITGVDARTGAARYSHTSTDRIGLQSLRVSGDHLVVGADIGLIGVFSKDLKVVWQHNFTSSDKPDKSYAFGNVVVSARSIDTTADTTKLWAFDSTTGKQLWSDTITGQAAIAPVAVNGTLVFVGPVPAWKLYGYDLATGKQKWVGPAIGDKDLGRDALGVADGTLFSGNHDIEITDPATGTVTFHKTMPYGSSNAPVAAGGHIIAVFADGVYGFN